MKTVTLIRDVILSLSLLAVGTSVVQAKTNCNGVLGGTHDDVIVKGSGCTLNGATVRGSVFVNQNRTLTATGGTEVLGNIQVDGGG